MPASSKSQQRFFGVVKAMQKGDIPKKGEAGKIAKSMDKDDVDKYASTKHKGKPEKVKREQRVRNLIKKIVREELAKMDETFMGGASKSNFGMVKPLVKAVKKSIFGSYEGDEEETNEASSKDMNQIKKIMKYDHIDDLADYIEQFDIDKKHWRVISHYFDNIRDEDMGIKPSGYADKSRKELQKILFKVIKEGKLSEAIGKGMFWKDLKSGTSIEFTGGTTYVVTKIDKNKLQMSLKRRGKTGGGLFASKAKLDKSQFESQVKVGFIKYLVNTNPRIKEGKLKEAISHTDMRILYVPKKDFKKSQKLLKWNIARGQVEVEKKPSSKVKGFYRFITTKKLFDEVVEWLAEAGVGVKTISQGKM